MILAEVVREWLGKLRGMVAAAGLALVALGAVLLAWPRPGGVIAVVSGGALLLLAWAASVAHALRKKLHLGP